MPAQAGLTWQAARQCAVLLVSIALRTVFAGLQPIRAGNEIGRCHRASYRIPTTVQLYVNSTSCLTWSCDFACGGHRNSPVPDFHM